MKKATPKKRKLLWLITAMVAVAVIIGVLVAVLLTGNSPAQSEQAVGQSDNVLYWNLDRIKYTQNSETGLSTREREADGLYHVRLLGDGRIIEVAVSEFSWSTTWIPCMLWVWYLTPTVWWWMYCLPRKSEANCIRSSMSKSRQTKRST